MTPAAGASGATLDAGRARPAKRPGAGHARSPQRFDVFASERRSSLSAVADGGVGTEAVSGAAGDGAARAGAGSIQPARAVCACGAAWGRIAGLAEAVSPRFAAAAPAPAQFGSSRFGLRNEAP